MNRRNGAFFTGLYRMFAFSVLFTLALASWVGAAQVTPADKQAYLEALRDTRTTTQEEVSAHLLAVLPDYDPINYEILHGEGITWEGNPGASRVLAATFMARSDYEKYYKENLESGAREYVLQKSLWVTVAPQLKNFFVKGECPPTGKRVKQLLGLHPAYDYDVLVEMWVDPALLFRPSADPEITDHEGERARKSDTGQWVFPYETNPFIRYDDTMPFLDSPWSEAGEVTFRQWYADRADSIYVVGDENDPSTWGWPWTRLGYTYDWGNMEHPEGVSEFIIRIDPAAGCARVTLHRAYDTASSDWNAYFQCEARPSPVLNFSVEGDTVSLVWNKVPDTKSYALVFSPYPAMSPATGVDLGPETGAVFQVAPGTSCAARILADKVDGSGTLSNQVVVITP